MHIKRDDAHRYFVDDDPEPYLSVTTVISETVAKSGLFAHTRREAIEYVVEHGDAPHYLAGTLKQRIDRLEASVTRYSMRKAEIGDKVHAAIERHIKTTVRDAHPITHDPDTVSAMARFHTFERVYKARWYASELMVAWPTYRLAGTIDALGWVTSPKTGAEQFGIIDFKTGRRTWLEHALQLVAYREIINHTAGSDSNLPLIDFLAILHLPDGESPMDFRVLDLNDKDFVRGFLHALGLARWLRERADVVAR